ncbi:MAG TPA: tetratricopeptide repeat protein [Anaerolineae bacterium]|nr:tetratricopeptide repeat protein [Anaerolineae bacterium]
MRTVAMVAGMIVVSLAFVQDRSPAVASSLADGIATYDRGEYPRAIAFLERAVSENPRSAEAHCWLGIAYGQQATGSEASGTLRSKAITELETAIRLDPRGAYGNTAKGWLARLRQRECTIALGIVDNRSPMPYDLSANLRASVAGGLRSCPNLRLVFGSERNDRQSREEARRHGSRWYASATVTRWEIDRPTPEQIRGAQDAQGRKGLSAQDVLATLSCSVSSHAGARVRLEDLERPGEVDETLVEATGVKLGYGYEAEQGASREAAKQIAEAIVHRLERFLELRSGVGVTRSIPYVSVPLKRCYALAGVVSIADAKRLPIVAVAPFAWGEAVPGGSELGEYASDMVARSILLTRRYAVITRQDFEAVTRVGPASSALPEQAREAGRSIGADIVIVGEVKSVKSWIRSQFLGGKKLVTAAQVSVRVLVCSDRALAREQVITCQGEAESKLPSGTQVEYPEMAPDLVEVTRWSAVAKAAEDVPKALDQRRTPRQ